VPFAGSWGRHSKIDDLNISSPGAANHVSGSGSACQELWSALVKHLLIADRACLPAELFPIRVIDRGRQACGLGPFLRKGVGPGRSSGNHSGDAAVFAEAIEICSKHVAIELPPQTRTRILASHALCFACTLIQASTPTRSIPSAVSFTFEPLRRM
jgi:hypothetical protein